MRTEEDKGTEKGHATSNRMVSRVVGSHVAVSVPVEARHGLFAEETEGLFEDCHVDRLQLAVFSRLTYESVSDWLHDGTGSCHDARAMRWGKLIENDRVPTIERLMRLSRGTCHGVRSLCLPREGREEEREIERDEEEEQQDGCWVRRMEFWETEWNQS